VAYAVLRRRLMLSRTKPPMPRRISDVGSGWAAAVIESERMRQGDGCRCMRNGPGHVERTRPGGKARSPFAAKTEIPRITLVSFINRLFPL